MSPERTGPAVFRPLDGAVALVTTAGEHFSLGIAHGLADAGAAVALVGGPGADSTTVASIESTGGRAAAISCDLESPDGAAIGFRAAAAALGSIDLVVHARIDRAALEPRTLAELSDAGWDRCCEAEIRCALSVCRASWNELHDRGGRLFFVTPTLSQTGAAEHAAYAAACEAVRILAKSAARRWRTNGINVNCIAPDLDALTAHGSAAAAGNAASTVQGCSGDPRQDIAPAIAALASEGGHFITGETIRMGGGSRFA